MTLEQIHEKLVGALPSLDIKLSNSNIFIRKTFFGQKDFVVEIVIEIFYGAAAIESLGILISATYPECSLPQKASLQEKSKMTVDYLNETQKIRGVFSNIVKGMLLLKRRNFYLENDFISTLTTEIAYDENDEDLDKVVDDLILLLKLFLTED